MNENPYLASTTFPTATERSDWLLRFVLAFLLSALAIRVGMKYVCLCTSLDGRWHLRDYIVSMILFGAPATIGLSFLFVRNCRDAVVIAAVLITALWVLHPVYVAWVH